MKKSCFMASVFVLHFSIASLSYAADKKDHMELDPDETTITHTCAKDIPFRCPDSIDFNDHFNYITRILTVSCLGLVDVSNVDSAFYGYDANKVLNKSKGIARFKRTESGNCVYRFLAPSTKISSWTRGKYIEYEWVFDEATIREIITNSATTSA